MLRGGDAVYTNFINNDIDAIKQAKDQGLHVVHELIIPPIIGRIAIEECKRFPEVANTRNNSIEVEAGINRDLEKWKLSDQVLVPSQFCFDTATDLGCDPTKITLVPYGISEDWFDLELAPEPGRILSVGRPSLLKGTHVLAEACRLLKSRGVPFECRVVGPLEVDVSHSLFEGPSYLGQVPRTQVGEEFRRADIFVLPTLADSFGLVHLEAMACGVPVITTPHCGSIVRDSLDGFIVPIRDAISLADRIQHLLEDRQLRVKMGLAARQRAAEFTWQCYFERLSVALNVSPL